MTYRPRNARFGALRGLAHLEWVSQALCEPLVAEKTYSLKLDLMFQTEGAYDNGVPSGMELWAGMSSCGGGEMLWRSPVVGPRWQTHCVTFRSSQPFSHFAIKAHPTTVTAGALVDNLRVVPSCDVPL